MGRLTSGSIACRRFRVVGELPEDFWSFIKEKTAAFSFKDIDDSSTDEYSTGWVSVVDMFDSEFQFGSYAVSDFVVLAMRHDERKVSPSIIAKFVAKEEARVKKERQIPHLSRAHRLEIKESVTLRLLRQTVPATQTYDLFWDPEKGLLYFLTTNKWACATIENLFRDSFGLSLEMVIPYTRAEGLVAPENRECLEKMAPAMFV